MKPGASTQDATQSPHHGRWLGLIVTGLLIGLIIGGLLLGYQWIQLLPRSVRRSCTEYLLRFVLIGYAAAWVIVPIAFISLSAWVIRSRGRRRPGSLATLARLVLLAGTTFFGLIGLELSAKLWEAWRHQMPTLPRRFATASTPGTLHIVVVGGSSALGEPYRPWLSIGQILGWQLEQALPGQRCEVTILAQLGACLEDMHQALSRLSRRPDLLVIYSGHNEFTARFEEERAMDLNEQPPSPLFSAAYPLSLHSPFCRLLYFTASRNRLDGPPPTISRHRLIDPPQVSPSEYLDVRDDFHRRLEAIVSWSSSIGCVPLLIIPPANEGDLEPSRSVLPPTVGPSERQWVAETFAQARRAGDSPADLQEASLARGLYQDILVRHPDFAEAHFRLAQIMERQGLLPEANRHYVAARDHDGLVTRCPTDFQDAYRAVAAQYPKCLLVDGPAVLRARSPGGILGDELIQDMHHPTLLGMVYLAEASLGCLRDRQVFGLDPVRAINIDPTACAEHFGMDSARWITVCDRSRVHYERIARYRYDPAARLARAASYAYAARQLQEGIPPEETDVVGLGVRADVR